VSNPTNLSAESLSCRAEWETSEKHKIPRICEWFVADYDSRYNIQNRRHEAYTGSATLPDSDDYVDCADGYKSYAILEQGMSKGEYVYVVIVEFKPGVRLRISQGLCTMILVYAGHFRMKNSKLS
jgi:hypothetical protein